MTTAEFRKTVRQRWPHVRVSVRTVSFADLARCDAKCLTVEGDRTHEELAAINALAREAGLVPDGNLRFRE